MFKSITFQFLNPEWLLLLPLAGFILWRFFKYYQQQSMWEQICDQHLLSKLLPASVKAKNSKWLVWVLTLSLTLSILAAAGPSWRSEPIPLFESAAARAIVLDLSRSMLAQDVKPTRFKRAIYKARDMIQEQVDGETALVVFAGAAFVVSPLTDDSQTLLNFLDSLNPDIMPVQGSRVDLGLSVAQTILHSSVSGKGHIFLLADGVSELDAALEQAAQAKRKGNRVSVLAFGTEQGGPLKDARGGLARDEQGQLIIAKVFFEDLEGIASAGGGKFSKMTASHDDIQYLLSSSDENEFDQSVDSQDRTLRLPMNDGIWLVWLVLPFAVLLFRKNVFWIVLMIALIRVDQPAYALDWSALWKNQEQRAYEAYKQGNFKQSGDLSVDPQLKGSAYYKQKEFENSQSWFARQGSAESFYNLGNSLAQQQQFQQAAAAYGRALDMDPEFEEARHNKKLVEEFIQQQQGEQARKQDENDKGEESNEDSSDQSESNQSQSQQSQAPRGSNDDDLQSDSTAEQQQQQKRVEPEPDDETDPSQEDLAMREQLSEHAENSESIDRWINRLPDDPAELLRRKFLRDYQRQRSQP